MKTLLKNCTAYALVVLLVTVLFPTSAGAQNGTASSETVPKGWWQPAGSSMQMKISGYVKFDMIHDFDPIGSTDFFDVGSIPTDGSVGKSTHLNGRESRLAFDFLTPLGNKKVHAHIETDFYGQGNSLRLRHAWAEYDGKLLVGQTWSNFMDENIIPATLDFEKPSAYAFARHAMIRYKHALSSDTYLAFAIEEPSAKGIAPAAAGSYESPMPDLTVRYRVTKDWGHVQLSGFLASLRYQYATGSKDDVSLYGGNLSGQFKIAKADNFIYQVVYGPGIGRYRGGNSTAIGTDGEITALTDFGYTVGFQHFWSKQWSSLVVYNYGDVETDVGQVADIDVNYFAANLLYHIAPGTFVGIEYLRGERQVFSGDSGVANRLQCSIKYSFNK